MKIFNFIIFFGFCWNVFAQGVPVNYLGLSEEILEAIEKKEDVSIHMKTLSFAKENQLAGQLGTDAQKIAFWVNIYNAYIQIILTQDSGKYNDRSAFFKEKQINIAGKMLSFADIEHGIIRGSQHEYFLGYVKRWFVDDFEKKFRVKKRDWRIHFALNCGAKSCPPVAIYHWERLDEQLNLSSEAYLKKFTSFVAEEQTAYVTSLFSWFRGDFDGLDGIKQILLDYKLIPNKSVKLKTTNYDWTLDLGNFINL
jgi:hypothetical protein